MALWMDEPIWPAHGRHFAHLISDTDIAELHACARAAGLDPRAFDGDHYDVPDALWHAVVEAGATPTTGGDLTRRLNASGLRIRKRRGDRALARYLAHPFPNGPSHVDLIRSTVPMDERQVSAAMAFVRDSAGHFVIVYSRRRDEWGSPGGWREPGESPAENAAREIEEETGLVVAPSSLEPVGYERFTALTEDNIFGADAPYLQVYRAQVPGDRPSITDGDAGVRETAWVSPADYERHCGHLFWWPLAAATFPDLPTSETLRSR